MAQSEESFVAFVGIDWGDEEHHACFSPADGDTPKHEVVQQKPEALAAWVGRLRQRFPQGQIAVCLEQARGALVFHLMAYDFLVLYPVNPKSLAAYREAFNPSGPKDDPVDCSLLHDLVRHHQHRLRPWRPDDEQTRTLAILVEARRNAVDERTRLILRLQALLKQYYPQALDLAGTELHTAIAIHFLRKWPTLADVQKAPDRTIREFYAKHHVASEELVGERLRRIRSAIPLTTDGAILRTSVITVKMLVTQLQGISSSIGEYEDMIAQVFSKHPDADIFRSFPGAGDALAPRLLVAWGTDRSRHETPDSMQCLSGIAPVTKRSGKTLWVCLRRACPKFLRQTFHEFADHSRKGSVWAAAYYAMLRHKGKDHQASIRALAYKWIRIMRRCWKDRVRYNEVAYIRSLQKRGAPLLAFIAKQEEDSAVTA